VLLYLLLSTPVQITAVLMTSYNSLTSGLALVAVVPCAFLVSTVLPSHILQVSPVIILYSLCLSIDNSATLLVGGCLILLCVFHVSKISALMPHSLSL